MAMTQEEINKGLTDAISEGHAAMTEGLILLGADPNTVGQSARSGILSSGEAGDTPLSLYRNGHKPMKGSGTRCPAVMYPVFLSVHQHSPACN